MSRLLSIAEVCEDALGKIGVFSPRQGSVRPADMDRARSWLDMLVGHKAEKARSWWLVQGSATFPLVANTATYDLAQALGATQAPDGVQFVIGVILYNTATGVDIHEVPIVPRREFEARNVPTDESPWNWVVAGIGPGIAPGLPRTCRVSRDQAPLIEFAPPPDDVTPYGIRVLFQSYARDFTRGDANSRVLGLRSAWNLWLVKALAAELGDGPVTRLTADEVRKLKKDADELEFELDAYSVHETRTTPRQIAYHNF